MRGMHHDALLYSDDEQFVAGVGSFVREGLHNGELTVVVEPPRQAELLRDGLGAEADGVRFLNMHELGVNPARIIAVWQELLDESTERRMRLRGVGEPAYVGRRDDELAECRIHEYLLNVAFGVGPSWNLLCPYDQHQLPQSVIDGATHTHPCVVVGHRHSARADAVFTELVEVFGADLPALDVRAQRLAFGAGEIGAVRSTVGDFARGAGMDETQVDDLTVVASELATNSVRHGSGGGTVSMWTDEAGALLEFTDNGVLDELLVGRFRPPPVQFGGRGIYLVNQLCDLVQIRSGKDGTRVRIFMRR
jgi:anti-sigma regulatory factor (Ser/Thr protein kinase)